MIFFTKNRSCIKTLILVSIIFVVYQIVLKLPLEISDLSLVKSKWNWSGKFYSVVFGGLVYLLLRIKIKPFDFIRFKQNNKLLKKTILWSTVPLAIAMFSYFDTSKAFDFETLVFQVTMPGIDEELMFRAILLGLLLKSFKDKFTIFKINLGNPSVLFVALLFGLVHGIHVSNNLKVGFEFVSFSGSFTFGYIWGWVTLMSRSILQAVVSHNLTNFIMSLLRMVN